MNQKSKLSYRSFMKVFFVFSVVFHILAWAVSSHPIFLTICICAGIFFALCGSHAWWKMRKLAKKGPTLAKKMLTFTPKKEVLMLPLPPGAKSPRF